MEKRIKYYFSIIIFCFTVTGLINCASRQSIIPKKNPIKYSLIFQKINEKAYSEYKTGKNNYSLLKDGTKFKYFPDKNELWCLVIPPSPAFYSYDYTYYLNTRELKSKGKRLSMAVGIKIGVWIYYDEEGNIIKKVDEDIKFGKFGYNELLRFLDKEKVINLKTGKNRDSDNLTIFYNEQDKIWTVIIYTEILNKYHHKGWEYKIDSNTGKVLEKKWLDEEIVI